MSKRIRVRATSASAIKVSSPPGHLLHIVSPSGAEYQFDVDPAQAKNISECLAPRSKIFIAAYETAGGGIVLQAIVTPRDVARSVGPAFRPGDVGYSDLKESCNGIPDVWLYSTKPQTIP